MKKICNNIKKIIILILGNLISFYGICYKSDVLILLGSIILTFGIMKLIFKNKID